MYRYQAQSPAPERRWWGQTRPSERPPLHTLSLEGSSTDKRVMVRNMIQESPLTQAG